MTSAYLSYLKEPGTVWFNPSYGINGFWDEYKKLAEKGDRAQQEIWAHRDLKRPKEIYTISILAKAMEKQEKTGRWWVVKPETDPPDGLIGTILETDGIQNMHVREVEVVEHIEGEILDTIRRKLSKKRYEPNTILACYVSQGGVYDLEKISGAISKEETSLENIFLIFPGARISDIPKDAPMDEFIRAVYHLSAVQIKPIFSVSSISPIEDCEEWRMGNEGNFFIYEGMGKGSSKAITLENPPKLF